MPKIATLLSLAATGVLATAAFVRPPVSPVPKGVTTTQNPPAAKPMMATPNALAANVAPKPFVVAPQTSQRAFVLDVVAFAPWGSGVGELGRELPKEASPEAPMSLTVDDAGNVHVLDQVNSRVVVFDGKTGAARVIPLSVGRTAQDLAIDPRGGYALLDRLVERAVIFVDATGKETSRVLLEDQTIPDAGVTTGLFAATDGFWVEVEHRNLVRVATKDGQADTTRPSLEGRRAGANLLRAARDPSGFAVISAIGTSGFLARVPFGSGVQELMELAADASGTTYVAARLGDEDPTTLAMTNEKVTVVALDGGGVEIGRFDLPAPDGPAEQLRAFAVSKSGVVHYLHAGNTGVTIRRAK